MCFNSNNYSFFKNLHKMIADKHLLETKEEDVVEYYLYPNIDFNSNAGVEKLDAVSSCLEAINNEINLIASNYIWHNDLPEIKVLNCDEPICLFGNLNYGENIEDEWFLVYIFLELTKKFEDLIIRVKDPDGEFLLIEAAEHLPSWVSPETCEDRVFLYKGHMHILPRSFPSQENCDFNEKVVITDTILNFIRSQPKASRVKDIVERPIFERIGNYPEKIKSLVHEAFVYVPVAVAALLTENPNLVTPAVRAFYHRDMIDLRACRAMKFFPPEERVFSRVKFTKCSYAMLVSSKYQPDKVTGWNLPPPSDSTYKAHLHGIKLACGFEILLSQAKGTNRTGSPDDIDQDWIKFKASLNSINYFRGLLEHSKEYNQLLNTAQNFFRNSCQKEQKKPHSGRVAELLSSIEVDRDELKRKEAEINLEMEDDSWLDVSKEDLDAMLAARFGRDADMVDIPNGHPEGITKHLNSFISHVSGVDGAEFPDKTQPERPKRGVKTKRKKNVQFSADVKMHSTNDPAPKENKVTIEPDGFMNAVQNILNFAIPDDNYWESDGSGMSSYEDEDEMDLGGPSANVQKASKTDNKMVEYMAEMDKQLMGTTLNKSFVKKPQATTSKQEAFDETEQFEPVDIDMNALKNILLSYKTQMGESGPAENILGPLGVNLADIDADVD